MGLYPRDPLKIRKERFKLFLLIRNKEVAGETSGMLVKKRIKSSVKVLMLNVTFFFIFLTDLSSVGPERPAFVF